MTELAAPSQWIYRPKPRPEARVRLFCIPYAGAGASVFRTWPDDLPADVEVLAIQLPGRESRIREAPLGTLSDLLPKVSAVIAPLLDRPFAIWGHSMGALIAFELAREFRRRYALLPQHFWASARQAPHLPERRSPMRDLPAPEFISELTRRYDGVPREVLADSDLMKLFLPMLRADISIIETHCYIPEPPLDCPISAFGGLEDPLVREDELNAWRVHTLQQFQLRMLPGNHFFLQRSRMPLLKAILEDLYGTATSVD
jgi:surfactin synthase thioesterase subunit